MLRTFIKSLVFLFKPIGYMLLFAGKYWTRIFAIIIGAMSIPAIFTGSYTIQNGLSFPFFALFFYALGFIAVAFVIWNNKPDGATA